MHVGLRMKFLHILAPKLRLQNIKFCENLVGVAPFYADGRTNEDVGRVSQPPPPNQKKPVEMKMVENFLWAIETTKPKLT